MKPHLGRSAERTQNCSFPWASTACRSPSIILSLMPLPESVLPPEVRMVSLLCPWWCRLSTWQKPQSLPHAATPASIRLHVIGSTHPSPTWGFFSESALFPLPGGHWTSCLFFFVLAWVQAAQANVKNCPWLLSMVFIPKLLFPRCGIHLT